MKNWMLVVGLTLFATSSMQATAAVQNAQNMDAGQAMIQDKMEKLAKTQRLMQMEIQSHFKRAQIIQDYQVCIQAASKKDDFRVCKMQFSKDEKTLDQEELSLRKVRH